MEGERFLLFEAIGNEPSPTADGAGRKSTVVRAKASITGSRAAPQEERFRSKERGHG